MGSYTLGARWSGGARERERFRGENNEHCFANKCLHSPHNRPVPVESGAATAACTAQHAPHLLVLVTVEHQKRPPLLGPGLSKQASEYALFLIRQCYQRVPTSPQTQNAASHSENNARCSYYLAPTTIRRERKEQRRGAARFRASSFFLPGRFRFSPEAISSYLAR